MSKPMVNTKSTTASATADNNQLYMQLNASELTAIIMKGSPNSNDRDAGFCSGSSDGGDDLSVDHSRLEPSSPTDASEDSLEVKVTPIALIRNKRKSSEPSKVICERDEEAAAAAVLATAPLKKRIRYTSTTDSAVVLTPPAAATPPPQLWDPSQALPHELMPNPAQVFVRHPGATTLHRVPALDVLPEQQEPLALVLEKPTQSDSSSSEPAPVRRRISESVEKTIYTPKKLQRRYEGAPGVAPPVAHKQPVTATARDAPAATTTSAAASGATALALTVRAPPKCESAAHSPAIASTSHSHSSSNSSSGGVGLGAGVGGPGVRPQQRNYKNMTRERRIEANARERTRVHTISAAYETLRRSVPSYSNAQKLSKLSVLRVACSYILTLSRMAGEDYSADQSAPSIADCFDMVTETIQTEGKLRKKKDE